MHLFFSLCDNAPHFITPLPFRSQACRCIQDRTQELSKNNCFTHVGPWKPHLWELYRASKMVKQAEQWLQKDEEYEEMGRVGAEGKIQGYMVESWLMENERKCETGNVISLLQHFLCVSSVNLLKTIWLPRTRHTARLTWKDGQSPFFYLYI